jgi:peptide deformylase
MPNKIEQLTVGKELVWMEKTIISFGDSLLRQKAKSVTQFDKKLFQLLDCLAETLYAAKGAGLAAPQIGVLQKVIIMDCGKGKIELINPEILEMRGEQIGPEGCLSFPGYTGIVKRANYVKISTITRKQEKIIIEGEGLLARCIQHEIDHLNGVLFIDHIQDNELYNDQTQEKVPLQADMRLSKKK